MYRRVEIYPSIFSNKFKRRKIKWKLKLKKLNKAIH